MQSLARGDLFQSPILVSWARKRLALLPSKP